MSCEKLRIGEEVTVCTEEGTTDGRIVSIVRGQRRSRHRVGVHIREDPGGLGGIIVLRGQEIKSIKRQRLG